MAEHDVEITLPSKPLVNVDARIVVRRNRRKLGEILISKGSFDWKPAGKEKAKKFGWKRLSDVLNEAQP